MARNATTQLTTVEKDSNITYYLLQITLLRRGRSRNWIEDKYMLMSENLKNTMDTIPNKCIDATKTTRTRPATKIIKSIVGLFGHTIGKTPELE